MSSSSSNDSKGFLNIVPVLHTLQPQNARSLGGLVWDPKIPSLTPPPLSILVASSWQQQVVVCGTWTDWGNSKLAVDRDDFLVKDIYEKQPLYFEVPKYMKWIHLLIFFKKESLWNKGRRWKLWVILSSKLVQRFCKWFMWLVPPPSGLAEVKAMGSWVSLQGPQLCLEDASLGWGWWEGTSWAIWLSCQLPGEGITVRFLKLSLSKLHGSVSLNTAIRK